MTPLSQLQRWYKGGCIINCFRKKYKKESKCLV